MSAKLRPNFPPLPEITDVNAGVTLWFTPRYSGISPIPTGLRVRARFTPAAADTAFQHDPHLVPKEQLIAGTPLFSVFPEDGENERRSVLEIKRQFARLKTVLSDDCAENVSKCIAQFIE